MSQIRNLKKKQSTFGPITRSYITSPYKFLHIISMTNNILKLCKHFDDLEKLYPIQKDRGPRAYTYSV